MGIRELGGKSFSVFEFIVFIFNGELVVRILEMCLGVIVFLVVIRE